jgi:hypothetical protein
MDGTGAHLKWRQSGSENQMMNVFSHMWNRDPIKTQTMSWKTDNAKGRSLMAEGR